MKLHVEPFENLSEVWITGSHSVEVYTLNNRHIKITADESVSHPPRFRASYEEKLKFKFPSGEHEVWVSGQHFPWERGDSIETCIQGALSWVNERGAPRDEDED